MLIKARVAPGGPQLMHNVRWTGRTAMNRNKTVLSLMCAACVLLPFGEPLLSADAPPEAHEAPRSGKVHLSEVSIGLERTECFGPCPVYRLSISGYGHVEFEGIKHVDAIGSRESRLPIDEVIGLINKFLEIHFLESPDEYRYVDYVWREGEQLTRMQEFVTCGSSTTLRLRMGEIDKEVLLYHNVPAEYTKLADTIDEVVGTNRWILGDK